MILEHIVSVPSTCRTVTKFDTLYPFPRTPNKYINKHTGLAFMYFVSMYQYCRSSFASHAVQEKLSSIPDHIHVSK